MSETNKNLKKAGLKVTLPRLKILELLERAQDSHLSAEDVYKTMIEQGEDVSLPTVYRVLKQFEDAGIVESHNFDNSQSTVYEITPDEHHDHLVCLKCNKVVEFTNKTIESEQSKVAKEHGFELTDHALILYGVCNDKDCEK